MKILVLVICLLIHERYSIKTSKKMKIKENSKLSVNNEVKASVQLKEAKGWFESAYIEWKLNGANGFNVYISGGQYTSYTKLDDQLVRKYGDYGRADAVGLKSGKYNMKVVPIYNGKEDPNSALEAKGLSVQNYNRGGFAHKDKSNVGAYNDDGTLKKDARILYVTASTASTVKLKMKMGSSESELKGIQTILDAYQKGYETRPLSVRIIGTVKRDNLDKYTSLTEGLQLKGKEDSKSDMSVTIEGIGNDATIYGFGLMLKYVRNVELRNFAVMWFMDDGVSIDTKNTYVWVHHLDLFYGQKGKDEDQAKGDGSIDVKADSQYITIAYVHFFDSGKASLCGLYNESGENFIDYNHNWFDHSDSRHPRIRTMSVHVWNNYFDGNAKYGVAAVKGASVFVESNYFRNVQKPMLSSGQGTEKGTKTLSGENGGIIKSYGNKFDSKSYKYLTQNNAKSFDAYEVSDKNIKVPDSILAEKGGSKYTNFDTSSKMHKYTPETADNAKNNIIGFYGAGRMNHGDIIFNFSSSEDSNYKYIPALMSLIQNYSSKLKGNFPEKAPTSSSSTSSSSSSNSETVPITELCHFKDNKPSNNKFSVSGNFGKSTEPVIVDGVKYYAYLKLDSKAKVTFKTNKKMNMRLYFGNGGNNAIKYNGVNKTSKSNPLSTTANGDVVLQKNDAYTTYLYVITLG